MSSPHMFPHRINISNPVATSAAGGGKTETETLVHSNIRARVQKEKAGNIVRKDREAAITIEFTHRIYSPVDLSAVQPGWLVAWNSQEFMVQDSRDEGGSGYVWTLYCKTDR